MFIVENFSGDLAYTYAINSYIVLTIFVLTILNKVNYGKI